MKNEEVLTIERKLIDEYNLLETIEKGDKLRNLGTALNKSIFLPRSDVENDLKYVQIIPYVMLVVYGLCGVGFLTYNRGTKGGEKRLSDKWSIGLGGHVNPTDGMTGNLATVNRAAKREVREELVGFSFREHSFEMKAHGVFYSNSTKVSSVHLGVFYTLFALAPCFHSMGDNIVDYEFVNREGLDGYDLEDWSSIVKRKYSKVILEYQNMVIF